MFPVSQLRFPTSLATDSQNQLSEYLAAHRVVLATLQSQPQLHQVAPTTLQHPTTMKGKSGTKRIIDCISTESSSISGNAGPLISRPQLSKRPCGNTRQAPPRETPSAECAEQPAAPASSSASSHSQPLASSPCARSPSAGSDCRGVEASEPLVLPEACCSWMCSYFSVPCRRRSRFSARGTRVASAARVECSRASASSQPDDSSCSANRDCVSQQEPCPSHDSLPLDFMDSLSKRGLAIECREDPVPSLDLTLHL
ncbi:hypothetical protein CLOM_g1351 [Closterium sp. NIES-68]|nr:hypothetical protein CLOM_g1351 [Closterium sp. NIES-68]GJP84275.1 hypothetical protein CLOP_g14338 [Closterium sp. NIES-67]